MNVDVSPDGRTVAFDLLGDIYTMPIAGGTPTRITSGPGVRHAAALLARRAADRLHLGPRRRRQYLGDERRRLRRARDHARDVPPAQRADLEPGRPVYRRAQAFHDAALARHRRDLALPRLGRRRRRAFGRAAQPAIPEGARRAGLLARRPLHLFQPQHHPGQHFRICAGFEPAGVRDRALRNGDRRAQPDRRRPGRRGPPARPRPTGAGSPTSTAPAAARGSS